MWVEGALTDLDSRGFVVVRQIIGDDEISEAIKDARVKRDEPSRLEAYNVQSVAESVVAAFQRACKPVLDEICIQTHIHASEFSPGNSASYFYVNNRQTAQWHTDYLSYYLLQSHAHYLNFWIPLAKPDRNKSGLAVIPMDVLEREDPAIYAATRGRGAATYRGPGVGGFGYEDDGVYKRLTPRVNLDALGVAPPLLPGDVLVVRTDVLHKTQDSSTDRIAISLRAVDLNQIVKRDVFLTMSQQKYERLVLESKFTASVLEAFQDKSELTVAELFAVLARAGSAPGRMPLPRWCDVKMW